MRGNQVKLHLSDDVRPLRHISPQYAVAMHGAQAAADAPGLAQHTKKQVRLRDVTCDLAQVAGKTLEWRNVVGKCGGISAVRTII